MSAYFRTIVSMSFHGTGERKRIDMDEETSKGRDEEMTKVGWLELDAIRLAG